MLICNFANCHRFLFKKLQAELQEVRNLLSTEFKQNAEVTTIVSRMDIGYCVYLLAVCRLEKMRVINAKHLDSIHSIFQYLESRLAVLKLIFISMNLGPFVKIKPAFGNVFWPVQSSSSMNFLRRRQRKILTMATG